MKFHFCALNMFICYFYPPIVSKCLFCLKGNENRFIPVNVHTVYSLCVSLQYASAPQRLEPLSIPAKPPDRLLLSIFCQFSPVLSVAPSFFVSKWIPPWWYGMWCESSDRGTLISEIHPGGLCPALSLSVQTLNFPTKTSRITAQPFTLSFLSHTISPPHLLSYSSSLHLPHITTFFKTQAHKSIQFYVNVCDSDTKANTVI